MKLSLLYACYAMFLCVTSLAFAHPIVRLRYVVQPVELKFWERTPSAAFLESIAREAFSLVNASPRVITKVDVMIGRDESCFCFLGFDSLEVVVEKFDTRVNLSYVFRNFALACRREHASHFDWLTRLAPVRVERGEYVLWLSAVFTKLTTLLLDPETGEVRDAETGTPLGEWIYQLRRGELGRNSTVVLAAYQPLLIEGREGIGGVATIVYVNFSQTAGWDYVLNDGRVKVSAARTAVGTSRYSNKYASILHGLPPEVTVEQFKRLLPPHFQFVDFSNGTYAVVCSYIYDSYEEVKKFKPWTLEKVHRTLRYEGLSPVVEVVGVVSYGGSTYEVFPLLPVTLVYDRVTGVLLEAIPGLPEIPWLHLDHLPSPLPNYFGASLWSVLSEQPLALRLVESSLHKEEVKLGGIGKVDSTAQAVAVALAALIVLLQSVRRLVGK